jgi:hypothetical protein
MTKQEWRRARLTAYERGEYIMAVPPVTTGGWDKIAWTNWVIFNNRELNGFDNREE